MIQREKRADGGTKVLAAEETVKRNIVQKPLEFSEKLKKILFYKPVSRYNILYA